MDYKAELFLKNVNNLSDARFAASEGFFAISFNMSSGSSSFMSVEKVKELNAWVSGPLKIAEFDKTIPDLINDTLTQSELELALIPYTSSTKDIEKINFPVILNISVEDKVDFGETKISLAEYLLVEINNSTLNSKSQSNCIASLIENHLVFISVSDDVNRPEVIERFSPFGLIIKGGKEYKPGIKNYERLSAEVDEMKY